MDSLTLVILSSIYRLLQIPISVRPTEICLIRQPSTLTPVINVQHGSLLHYRPPYQVAEVLPSQSVVWYKLVYIYCVCACVVLVYSPSTMDIFYTDLYTIIRINVWLKCSKGDKLMPPCN